MNKRLSFCFFSDIYTGEDGKISKKHQRACSVSWIIIAPVGYEHGHIDGMTENGVPIVAMDRYFPGHHLPYVTTDNYSGAYQAGDYLLGFGHTSIACIQGIQGISVNTSRVQGYRDALLSLRLFTGTH